MAATRKKRRRTKTVDDSSQRQYTQRTFSYPADSPIPDLARELAARLESENPVRGVPVPIHAAVRYALELALGKQKDD